MSCLLVCVTTVVRLADEDVDVVEDDADGVELEDALLALDDIIAVFVRSNSIDNCF